MKRRTFLERVRKECGAPEGTEDCSERWDGSLAAQLLLDERAVRGRLELVATHITLCTAEGSVLAAVPVESIASLQRRREIHFPTRSFADEPAMRSTLELETMTGSAVQLSIDGPDGVHVCKAIEKLWRYTHDALESEREAAMFRSFRLGDALYALSLLPLDVECVLAQQVTRTTVSTIDRPVVIRVEEDFTLAIIFRPDDVGDAHNLKAMSLPLDDVNLIWAKGDDIRLCLDDGRILLATSITNAAGATRQLHHVYLANAATMVYRRLQQQKPIAAFGHDEAAKLFQHYCCVDADLDGSISPAEFLVAIGPILGAERALPNALYELFDCFALGKIRAFEYLHGCRVLLRGDADDRLHYLFLLFDTTRRASISYQQFLDGLKTLAAAVPLRIPRGETIETFSFRLFEEIDTNGNDDIDFDEFRRALTGNIGIIEALKNIAEEKEEGGVGAIDSTTSSAVVSFGHPQWHQITQILAGIQLAVTHTVPHATSAGLSPTAAAAQAVDPAAFTAKFTYNCSGGLQRTMRELARSGSGSGSGSGSSRSLLRLGKDEEVHFNDYCPAVFRAIRMRFGITDEAYLRSLGINQLKRNLLFGCLTSLFEMSSSGRSGSFFYASHDNKFILKTIPAGESATLRRILPSYLDHVQQHPDTFLTRFCGLHALLRGGQKMIFVVMANIFLNKLPIHVTFDLKGSTVNRSTPLSQRDVGVALKDNDFRNRRLHVASQMKEQLLHQVEADSQLLSRMNLNDYSFLLGIHESDTTLHQGAASDRCVAPQHSVFQQFYGGVASTARSEVYYMGVIDTLTDFGVKKRGEHLSKSVIYDEKQVSCIPPADYQRRFVDYIDSIFLTSQ